MQKYLIKLKTGNRAISKEQIASSLKAGKLAPAMKVISIDDGKTFITVQQALAISDLKPMRLADNELQLEPSITNRPKVPTPAATDISEATQVYFTTSSGAEEPRLIKWCPQCGERKLMGAVCAKPLVCGECATTSIYADIPPQTVAPNFIPVPIRRLQAALLELTSGKNLPSQDLGAYAKWMANAVPIFGSWVSILCVVIAAIGLLVAIVGVAQVSGAKGKMKEAERRFRFPAHVKKNEALFKAAQDGEKHHDKDSKRSRTTRTVASTATDQGKSEGADR